MQYSDCRSLTDHLLCPIPKQVEDNRLGIELASLRQAFWEDDILSHVKPSHHTATYFAG